MVDTVLFDMDGTLLDTEKYLCKCWVQAAKNCGYEMTIEQALSMRSLGRPFALGHLKEMLGEDADYHKIREERKRLFNECIAKEGIQKKEGAEELLSFLKEKGIRSVIVTATDLSRAQKYLSETGLLPYFSEIVSATMVKEGKPSPDVYLYACEQLKKKPEECIAIEDSPNGITSAYRAGCKVIMVPDQTQPDKELEKKITGKAETLSQVISLLSDC